MPILSLIIVAGALAMDAFSIAVTVGGQVKGQRQKAALTVAGYFGFFQGAMALGGWWGGRLFAGVIETIDHWIAIALLVAIGGKMIRDSFSEDEKPLRSLSHRLLFGLAIATSIDALAVGISFALLGEPINLAAIIIAAVAFLFSYTGVLIGKQLGSFLGSKTDFLGGLILLGISVKVAFDHGVF